MLKSPYLYLLMLKGQKRNNVLTHANATKMVISPHAEIQIGIFIGMRESKYRDYN